MKPLNSDLLGNHLTQLGFSSPIELICLDSVDSTQHFLKNYPARSAWVVCCAETQTQGRGRFGRHWHSPAQRNNIYCSIRLSVALLQGISLVIGLAILSALKQLHLQDNIMLKWPNDLLWRGRKLGGILIETVEISTNKTTLILGVGLNLAPTYDESACSLSEITGKKDLDRHVILAQILLQMQTYLSRFEQKGLSDFQTEWDKADALKGKIVSIKQPKRQITGKACGITPKGELVLEDSYQQLHAISSGEATLSTLDF